MWHEEKTIFRLLKDYKPLRFFGTISVVLAIPSVALLVPVLTEYYRTGLVPRLPSFVASCFFALFSLLFFFCGLVLDTILRHSRQSLELQMNIIQKQGEQYSERPETE